MGHFTIQGGLGGREGEKEREKGERGRGERERGGGRSENRDS